MSVLSQWEYFKKIIYDFNLGGSSEADCGKRVDCAHCNEWVVLKKTASSLLSLREGLEKNGWEWHWHYWHGETKYDVYRDLKWLCPSCAKVKRQRDKERRKAEQELIAKHTIEY